MSFDDLRWKWQEMRMNHPVATTWVVVVFVVCMLILYAVVETK